MTYPKWRYTKDLSKAVSQGFLGENCCGRIVMDEEQDKALGLGWYDTPSECDNHSRIKLPDNFPIIPENASDKDRLWKVAEERGIKIDKRWSVSKLIEVIEAGNVNSN